MPNNFHHSASFRDPSGFVFLRDGIIYRQVNQSYATDYEFLIRSGLYKRLTDEKLLIPHREIAGNFIQSPDWYKTLEPEAISFISYPYEWSVAQLKEAAQLTLKILMIAMDYGMIIKDANAFNIQFHQGSLVFIDTLSFIKYDAGQPWVAYRQFCECFLFPLYLSHYLKTDIQKCLSAYPEGIPAALTARLLPVRSRFHLGVWLHVYLQNSVSKRGVSDSTAGNNLSAGNKPVSFNRKKLRDLVQHLQNEIRRLAVKTFPDTLWSNYYKETILGRGYLQEKEKIFMEFIGGIHFQSALDVGANDGHFSKILAEEGKSVIAIDSDHQCINSLYLYSGEKSNNPILPLFIDIANPSPAIGFRNTERESFIQRVNVDMVTALAIVHHLVLGKNIPLSEIAGLSAALTQQYLIIEFVPLADPKAQELIRNKSQYHLPYDEASFENSFICYFIIEKKKKIPGTDRVLYQMRKMS
jgi:hypothetical protein